MRSAFRTTWYSALTLMFLVLSAIPYSSGSAQPPAARPAVSATVSFHCLWWSETQMEGLNPNSPPPKTKEIKIEKWEYSDPIGVPHPDVVDVVVDLRNESAVKADNLTVNVSALWKTGPQRKKARAIWSPRHSLRRFSAIGIEAGGTQTLRVPVDLVGKMKTLRKTRGWPWMLRVQVTVLSSSGRLLSKTTSDLPIIPGD